MSSDGPRAVSAALGAALAGAAYLVTTAGRAGLLHYLPVERRWERAAPVGAIAMDWYSRAGWTVLACAAGVIVGQRLGESLGDRAPRAARALWQLAWLTLGWSALFTVLWLVQS